MSRALGTRRSFLGQMAAALPLCLWRGAVAQSPPRPRLHALIVGMNVYTGHVGLDDPRRHGCVPHAIPQLRGCINDAHDIEASVRPLAASTRRLLDREVSRAAFLQAWRAMVADAAEGDTLLLTFSGHGGQEPERIKGSEPNGLSDTLVLSPFDGCVPGLDAERIVDDEIAGLLASVRARNRVIFVADACHSGTMTRSAVDARVDDAIRYRTVRRYDAAALLPRVEIAPAPSTADQPHVLYLSACEDDELVPELMIDGRYRGALSFAFARALAGCADANQDGIITGAELAAYVLRTVRAFSDSNQHPEIRWPHADVVAGSSFRRDDAVFVLGASANPATSVPPAPHDRVRLRILGDDPAAAARVRELARVTLVDGDADAIWDIGRRRVLDQIGSVIAWDIGAGDLQAVVDGLVALDDIRRMIADSGIDMRLRLPGEAVAATPSRASDRIHTGGARFTLVAAGLRHPHFVLFNIAGNGAVQLLYPCHAQGGACRRLHDASAAPVAGRYELELEATTPFGADHVVAVSAAHPPAELIAALEAVDGRQDPMKVVTALSRLAEGHDVLVGMQGIFTAKK